MPHIPTSASRTSNYSQSTEDSFLDNLRSRSRSPSGTSETQYDALDLPPKAFMDEYAQDGFNMSPLPQDRGLRSLPASLDNDPTSMHLLVESAAAESQFYDVLTPDELEKLRQEESSISRSVEALKRKLYLESKVRIAAQSLSRLSGHGDDAETLTSAEDLAASTKKCEDLARDLWRSEKRQAELREQRLRHTAGVLQLQHQKQSQTRTKTNGYVNSEYEDWFDGFGFGAHTLADTSDGILDLPGSMSGSGSSKEMDAMLAKLWEIMKHSDQVRRQQRSAHDDDDNDSDYGDEADDEYSAEAFSNRLERICRQAETSGGQAKLDDAISRSTQLEQELRELVAEHETLVQEGINAERDREKLESQIDELREQVETLSTKMHDDKMMNMARSPGGPDATQGDNAAGAAKEGSHVGLMRGEFKKIMRDARAEHLKSLRAEQEERRRLEGIIRTLRKEQGLGSPASLAPPGTARKTSLAKA